MQRKYRKKYFTIRLDEGVVAEIRRLAQLNRRPVANLIALWIHQSLEAEQARLEKLADPLDVGADDCSNAQR